MGQSKKFTTEILNNPKTNPNEFEALFNNSEHPIYKPQLSKSIVLLENGYVKSKILNPEKWSQQKDKIAVIQIDIIFTKYPKEKEFWKTDYYELLAARLKELFKIDSTLNDNSFEWNIILQTNCNNEEQAAKLFHGIAIHYVNIDQVIKESSKDAVQTNNYEPEELGIKSQKVINFIKSQGGFRDSVVMKIFDRKKDWERSLIVMDWTGSMHKYAAQAILWHILNFQKSGEKYFCFFNDGDRLPDEKKQIGKTGGIYFSNASDLENLINTFYVVSKNGDGGDEPENDVEALLKAAKKYPDFDEIILIADNNSCVRDFSLIKDLDVSLDIILCGTENGINPQYINMAYLTGGSIHTIEEDIENLSGRLKDNKMKVWGIDYTLGKNNILISNDPSKTLFFNDCNQFSNFIEPDFFEQVKFIEDHGGITDSTVIKALDRHPLWQNALIVMDWSVGMYTNSAQAVLWQKMNLKKSGIRYYAFFNDGDLKKARDKKIGKTNGIYCMKANNIPKVTRNFYYVKKRGDGGNDGAANDVEALVKSSYKFRKNNLENIVLIADNNTCIRDLKLCEFMDKPVKIILTGVAETINPQYLTLAFRSKGSIHLLNEDVYYYVIKSTLDQNQSLLIHNTEYILDEEGNFTLKDPSLAKKIHNCSKYDKESFLKELFSRD